MKNEKIKFNLNVNIQDIEYTYIWNEFKSKPNRIKLFDYYSKSDFLEVISPSDLNINREVYPSEDFYIKNDFYLSKLNDGLYVSYIINDSDSDDCIVTDVTFYYKDDNDALKVDEYISSLTSLFLEDDKTLESESNLFTMSVSEGNIQLEPFEYEVDEHIDMFYTDKTFKSVKKLSKSILGADKGLSIIYGNRGTGKTSLVKYIAKKINKSVIYVPNNLMDSLFNPEFKNFIRSYHNCVIVIDDCEYIFNDVYSKSNSYTNSVLQNIDGLSSLNLNYLMIFNNNDDSIIDVNLLDSNNLIDVVNVEDLDLEKSKELSKHLGFKEKVKSGSRLIDVLNKKTSEKVHKIGLS